MNNRNNLLAPPTPSVSYAPSGSVSGTPATSRAVSPAVVSKNPAAGERQKGNRDALYFVLFHG